MSSAGSIPLLVAATEGVRADRAALPPQSCLVGFARPAEQREALFQVVRQQREPEQVVRGSPVVLTCRLRAQLRPVLDPAVAAAEPGERDEIDLLVLAECADETRKLAHDGVILMILEHGD